MVTCLKAMLINLLCIYISQNKLVFITNKRTKLDFSYSFALSTGPVHMHADGQSKTEACLPN